MQTLGGVAKRLRRSPAVWNCSFEPARAMKEKKAESDYSRVQVPAPPLFLNKSKQISAEGLKNAMRDVRKVRKTGKSKSGRI